jgi:hypothetical protein
MKLTKDQYQKFIEYVDMGIAKTPEISFHKIKEWLTKIGDEKLSHFNALNALKLAKRANDDAYFWCQSLNLNDSHWATVGRKYFKDFKKINNL